MVRVVIGATMVIRIVVIRERMAIEESGELGKMVIRVGIGSRGCYCMFASSATVAIASCQFTHVFL